MALFVFFQQQAKKTTANAGQELNETKRRLSGWKAKRD